MKRWTRIILVPLPLFLCAGCGLTGTHDKLAVEAAPPVQEPLDETAYDEVFGEVIDPPMEFWANPLHDLNPL